MHGRARVCTYAIGHARQFREVARGTALDGDVAMSTSMIFYLVAFAGAPVLLIAEQAVARWRGVRIHDPREHREPPASNFDPIANNFAP